MAPDTWFWAHDARPDQLDSPATPGLRLVRLSHYGSSRYAALFHSGTPTACRIGLDAASAVACTDAIAITVDDRACFSVVTEPGAATVIHVDLDADELRSAVGEAVDVAAPRYPFVRWKPNLTSEYLSPFGIRSTVRRAWS